MKLLAGLLFVAGLLCAQVTATITYSNGQVTAAATNAFTGGSFVCKLVVRQTNLVNSNCTYTINGIALDNQTQDSWVPYDVFPWTLSATLMDGMQIQWYLYSYSWEPGEIYYTITAVNQQKSGTF